MVIASACAPFVAPLWAIGVAMAMALLQWCPCRPGIFDGNRIVTVGIFQLTSPISSDPPLRGVVTGRPREESSVLNPLGLEEPTSVCTAFANC